MSDESAVNRELERELAEPFDFAWRESHHAILDSIACNLHNKGYSLQGNTEESDFRWLARAMYCDHPKRYAHEPKDFDRLDEAQRAEWVLLAEIAVKCMPALMGRIAHRVILMSQALRTLERAKRSERRERKEDE
jgi:hypothetical protein